MAAEKRILVVLGTRPEAIKLAPVVKELRARPGVSTRVCLTGQHREMVASILAFFEIEPDADLGVMEPNQTLSGLASRALVGLDRTIAEFSPDWTVVQGDTTTAFTAALASFHRRVRVAHVEAGLRSFDRHRPFPEEVNRVLTAVVTDLHFCPTEGARENLLAERVPGDRIRVVGNTVIDALHLAVNRVRRDDQVVRSLAAAFPRLRLEDPFVLVTGHRRESFGEPFEDLCRAIAAVAAAEGIQFVYPVHLNPNVHAPAHALLGSVPNIYLIEPQDYVHFVYLMGRAYLIVTDSGGVQEEAPALGKPVLVTRACTERPEAIRVGAARLVGTDPALIIAAVERLLNDRRAYEYMAKPRTLYGDGQAGSRIAQILLLGNSAGAEASHRTPINLGLTQAMP